METLHVEEITLSLIIKKINFSVPIMMVWLKPPDLKLFLGITLNSLISSLSNSIPGSALYMYTKTPTHVNIEF